MSTIVTRAGKGSALTHVEVDANFTNLNTDKIQSGNTVAALTITSATINGGTITGITDLAVADGGTGTSTAFTTGSVVFAGASGIYTQDNANFFWDNTNNYLGIGTTSPSAFCHTSGAGVGFKHTNGSVTMQMYTDGVNSVQTANSIFFFQTTGANPFIISTNTTERVRVDATGNVGIGTSSPDALLTVNTIASFGDGAVGTPSIAHKGDLNTGLWFPAADTIAASTAGSERMRITSAGNVGIGTTSPDANLTVNGAASFAAGTALLPSIARAGDLNTGIFFPAADTIAFAEGGAEAMRINSSSNVQIGSVSVAGKLGVYGDAVNFSPSADNSVNGIGACILGNNVAVATSAVAKLYMTGGNAAHAGCLDLRAGSVVESSINMYAVSAAQTVYLGSSATANNYIMGNVGIGTTTPPTLLATSVSSGFNGITTISSSSSFMGISSNSNSNSAIAYKSTESLGFGTITSTAWGGYTERMRLDSSGNLGIGTSSPSASAILDAQSTTKGVRMPNMTTTQKNAISSPAAGLIVFDTTLAKLCVYSGSAWQTVTSI